MTGLPRLPDIMEVRPVGSEDDAIFDEIRAVLERHNALGRFGVTLLHQHFDIGDDEVLVEQIDALNRILDTRPVPKALATNGIETSWRLDDPSCRRRCETQCQPDRDWEGRPFHRRAHYTTS